MWAFARAGLSLGKSVTPQRLASQFSQHYNIKMYSRDETVLAVTELYQQIILHPYLPSSALIFPPSSGWATLNPSIESKNATVHSLLKHLPYLRPEKEYERLCVHWETIPINHSSNEDTGNSFAEGIYPLPDHCVYLTRSVDREGTALILDTNDGIITDMGPRSRVEVPYEEYDALPLAEKWTKHRRTPVKEFLDAWTERYNKIVWMLVPNPIGKPTSGRFYCRAERPAEEEELLRLQGPWHYQTEEGASEAIEEKRKHAAVGPLKNLAFGYQNLWEG